MSYAPFSSTSERLFHEKKKTSMHTPGPGAYRAWELHDSVQRREESRTSNIFKTGVPRLDYERTEFSTSPGPGSYNLMQGWIKPKHSYNRYNVQQQSLAPSEGVSETRLIFRKRATAPSVPARNQSYGYEETSAGDLIMQEAPKVGFTGIKEDTVGPGRYRPTLKPKHRFTDFSRSTTTRKLFSVNANPGPGQYTEPIAKSPGAEGSDQEQATRTSAGATTRTARTGATSAPAMPSSNFASKVKKLAENQAEKERTPGPGSYNAAYSSRVTTATLSREAHGFLSTVSRSYEIDETQSHAAPTPLLTPGPGTYQNEQSSFFSRQSTYKDPMNIESAGHVAPFSSTSRRFIVPRHLLTMPGPGAYDEDNENSFVTTLGKRVMSRAGVFGTTATRFGKVSAGGSNSYDRQEDSTSPGPGAYGGHRFGSSAYGHHRKAQSVFASTTPRFGAQSAVDPAMGKAGITHTTSAGAGGGGGGGRDGRSESFYGGSFSVDDDVSYPRLGSGADSQSPMMMMQRPKTEAPPPGAYELQDLWNTGKNGRNRNKDTFISSSPRFIDDVTSREIAANPGPGTYNSAFHRSKTTKTNGKNLFKSKSIRFKDPDSFTPGPGSYQYVGPTHSMMKRSFNVTIDE